jgi:hypothetical protein
MEEFVKIIFLDIYKIGYENGGSDGDGYEDYYRLGCDVV